MAKRKDSTKLPKIKPPRLVKSKASKPRKTPSSKLFSSAQQRKEFRHAVSVLKKKGLLPKSVDARKALPTRDLRKTLKEFDAVLKHEARVFTIPTKLLKEYKKIDYTGRRNKIVVPKTEYVAKTKTGFVVREKKQIAANATAKIDILPVRPDDVEAWLQSVESTHPKKFTRGNQRYAFRFYGHNSRSTFSGIEQLTAWLRGYDAVQRALSGDRRANVEVPRNVEIITVDVRKYAPSERVSNEITRGKVNATGRNTQQKSARYLAGRAAYMRRYRATRKMKTEGST